MVIDLGAGTGANLRYLGERLPVGQRWRLVDHDADLLAMATASRGAGGPERITTLCTDIRRLDAAVFAGAALVTASALLDLVSDAWLRTLSDHCVKQRAAVLFALTYDGRLSCSPEDPEDGAIRELVNRHQRTDKGFGPALGPDAAMRAADLFQSRGYRVVRGASDWRLGPDQGRLQRLLIEGWARAAAAIQPEGASTIAGWRERRVAHVAAGRSRLVVGHEDVGGMAR